MAEPVPTGTMGKSQNLAETGKKREKEKKAVLHLMKSQPAVWSMKTAKRKHKAIYLLHVCIFCSQWLLFCAQLSTTRPHVRRQMALCFNAFHCGS